MAGWVTVPHGEAPQGVGPLYPTEDGQMTYYDASEGEATRAAPRTDETAQAQRPRK